MPCPDPRTAVSRACLAYSAATVLLALWSLRILPPLGTDSLIYHLSIPAMWLQRGFLAPLDLPFHDGYAEHSPLLAETVFWALMRLTGDDALAWLVPPACLLGMAWLACRSARLLGCGRAGAMQLACAVLVFPPFFRSMLVCNSELVLALGAALLLHGVLLARRRAGAGLIWGAAGMALMTASKTVGLIYAAAGAVALVPAARAAGMRERACAALLLLAGSSFLVVTWVRHGNPVHPGRLTVAGVEVFRGLYALESRFSGPSLAAAARMLFWDAPQFAPGPPCGLALAAGLAFSAALAALCRRARRWPRLACTLLFPLVSAVLYFGMLYPLGDHRQLFPVYYALWLGLAASLALGIPRAFRDAAFLGLVAWEHLRLVLGTSAVARPAEVWLGLAGLAILAGWLGWRPVRRWAPVLAAVAVALCVLGWPSYRALAREREEARPIVYAKLYGAEGRAWAWLDAETRGRPRVLAYAGSPVVYPLFGARLANRVVYVPVGPDDHAGHALALKPGDELDRMLVDRRRSRPDEAVWLARLRRSGAGFLYLVDHPRLGGVAFEREAAARHPEVFSIAFSEGPVSMLRIRWTRGGTPP